ncbi:uncharacterized protein LOC135343155 [Halichondria panicea]|uniref:uncharacterized protein LOC135343155 n=1 Tax=Halichondria panicea TaxID=6063 RepID=UPI00312B6B84
MKLLVLLVLAWSEINLCTATGDAELTVSFTETSFTVTEGGEAVPVCVAVTPALVAEAMVMVELMSSEGFSQDLTVDPTSTLTFTNITTQVCWNVAALDDPIFENSESFTLTIVPMTAGVSVGQQSTVTVMDNDNVTVAMTHDQWFVTEGEMVMVCVTLTGQLGRSVVVSLTSTVGTASLSDFSLASGKLMFTTSNTNQECSVVTATSDDIFEDDETFTVTLNPNSLPSGVIISGRSSTTVTISANGGVTIQMMETQEQVMEGETVMVCASLTAQLGRNVEVRLATSSEETASDTDFVSASVTRTFTATDTTDFKCIDITTSEDNIFEANEMFTVSLSVVSPTTGVTVIEGRSQTTVIIVDDDEVMAEITTSGVTNSEGDILVTEGQSVQVCVAISGATISDREAVVRVATSELDDIKAATSNSDYEHLTVDVTFTVSQVCRIIIQTKPDLIYEHNEVFSVNLSVDASANPRVRLGTNIIIRITDRQRAVISLVNQTIVQNEGDGDVSVCARLDSPVGGAEKEIFITLNNTNFTFPSNSPVRDTQCLNMTVTNDNVYQTSPVLMETVTLSKRINQGRLDLTNTVATVTINDDDDAVVSMDTPTMTTTEGGVVEVCANLVSPSGGTSVPITVVFAWSGGPSTANFSANSNANTRACIQLTVADDDIYGTSPIPVTFLLSISSPNSRVTVGGIGQTTVTVNDDDDPVLALSQLSYTFAEATEETGEICVVLEGPSGGLATGTLEVLFTIDIVNINRPATLNADFTTSSLVQTRQFSTIGESRCISVTIVDDDTADPGESFLVTVTSPNNRVTFRGGAVAIVIIDNDDVLPGATNLRTSTTESRRVSLMWDRPDTTSITVALIEYSVQVTGTNGFTSMSLTTNSNSPFIVINNLFPYQQYQFFVSAIYQLNNIGEGDSIVVRTGQEAPGILTAPTAISMATTLTLSWDPPAEPNGVIITYTLYVDYRNGTITKSTTSPERLTFSIYILSPYQTVSVQVSASTSVGEGPPSNPSRFTTAEAKSGPVGSLRVLRVNKTTLTVNWIEPVKVNGMLQTYTITTKEEGSSSAVTEYNTSATSFSISQLVPYTPYVVSVAAINGAGAGEPVSVVEFTAEGIPIFHPRDIGSTRLNGTAVRVSWRPLSRSEARGFITNYTITYWRVGSNAANASTITVSGEDASSAIIINLDPNSDYYFTVSAGTVQGVGNVSFAMVILTQSSGQPIVGGIVAGLIVSVVLLTIILIIVGIVCIIRRRQHGGPKQESASRNPAYGMSVIQAPNDAVNVQSNDEHTYEHIGDIRVDEVVYETIDADKNSGEGEAVMVSSNAAYGVKL